MLKPSNVTIIKQFLFLNIYYYYHLRW